MKKIGKIIIRPEKVIKNEELVNLRGGYETYECVTKCITNNGYTIVYNPTCSSSGINAAYQHVYGWTGASICVGCD